MSLRKRDSKQMLRSMIIIRLIKCRFSIEHLVKKVMWLDLRIHTGLVILSLSMTRRKWRGHMSLAIPFRVKRSRFIYWVNIQRPNMVIILHPTILIDNLWHSSQFPILRITVHSTRIRIRVGRMIMLVNTVQWIAICLIYPIHVYRSRVTLLTCSRLLQLSILTGDIDIHIIFPYLFVFKFLLAILYLFISIDLHYWLKICRYLHIMLSKIIIYCTSHITPGLTLRLQIRSYRYSYNCSFHKISRKIQLMKLALNLYPCSNPKSLKFVKPYVFNQN